MSLSKTWYTSANLAAADITTALRASASGYFALKNLLTGGLAGTAGTGGQPTNFWTVHSSSDGVTASNADNLGGNTFTAAKWVRAAAGVAHSWFVLQSPASGGLTTGPYYLMLSMGTAADANCIIAISRAAPSGGTTTADPTSSPVQSIAPAAQYFSNTTAASKYHLVMDAKGNFHFLGSVNGGNRFVSYVGVHELTEVPTGDLAPVVLYLDFLTSGTGVPRFCTTNVSSGIRGMCNDGTTAASSSTALRMANLTWSGNTDSATRTAVNNTDSKVDGIPMAHVYDTTASHATYRGRVPDVWYMGATVAVGCRQPQRRRSRPHHGW
jgi:hypothetical protein